VRGVGPLAAWGAALVEGAVDAVDGEAGEPGAGGDGVPVVARSGDVQPRTPRVSS